MQLCSIIVDFDLVRVFLYGGFFVCLHAGDDEW